MAPFFVSIFFALYLLTSTSALPECSAEKSKGDPKKAAPECQITCTDIGTNCKIALGEWFDFKGTSGLKDAPYKYQTSAICQTSDKKQGYEFICHQTDPKKKTKPKPLIAIETFDIPKFVEQNSGKMSAWQLMDMDTDFDIGLDLALPESPKSDSHNQNNAHQSFPTLSLIQSSTAAKDTHLFTSIATRDPPPIPEYFRIPPLTQDTMFRDIQARFDHGHPKKWTSADMRRTAPDHVYFDSPISLATKNGHGQFDKDALIVFVIMQNDQYTMRWFTECTGTGKFGKKAKIFPFPGAGHTSLLTVEEQAATHDNYERLVHYAGQIYTNMKGQIVYWENDSGHFGPRRRWYKPVHIFWFGTGYGYRVKFKPVDEGLFAVQAPNNILEDDYEDDMDEQDETVSASNNPVVYYINRYYYKNPSNYVDESGVYYLGNLLIGICVIGVVLFCFIFSLIFGFGVGMMGAKVVKKNPYKLVKQSIDSDAHEQV